MNILIEGRHPRRSPSKEVRNTKMNQSEVNELAIKREPVNERFEDTVDSILARLKEEDSDFSKRKL